MNSNVIVSNADPGLLALLASACFTTSFQGSKSALFHSLCHSPFDGWMNRY